MIGKSTRSKFTLLLLFALIIVGCGKATSPDASSPADVQSHLSMDQIRLNDLTTRLDASPTGTSSSSSSSGTPVACNIDPATDFNNLLSEIQQIQTDAQNQDTSALSSDLQALQASIVADTAALEAQLQQCELSLPTATAAPTATSTGSPTPSPIGLTAFPMSLFK